MSSLVFSGHDTFHCRQFWLKKAYDYVEHKKSFTDPEASLDLGVGKNMVTAIRFWARAYQILNEDGKPNEIAQKVFSDNGWDPFLEDHGTLWLLHYMLVTGSKASTFSIIFNELIKERQEFTAEHFIALINRKDGDYNQNTLKKDFTVFYRTYYADFKASDIEESFTGILTEINLLKKKNRAFIDSDGKSKNREIWFMERGQRNEIPLHILLYAVLAKHAGEKSIGFDQLYNGENEIGSVFALSKEGLSVVLERFAEELEFGITFSNEAGIRELQFKKNLNPLKVLEAYYEN